MNNQQRKELAKHISELQDIEVLLQTVKDAIEEMSSEEREKFDNLSEGLQASDKGQAIDEAANSLETADSELDGVVDDIQELIEKISDAVGNLEDAQNV